MIFLLQCWNTHIPFTSSIIMWSLLSLLPFRWQHCHTGGWILKSFVRLQSAHINWKPSRAGSRLHQWHLNILSKREIGIFQWRNWLGYLSITIPVSIPQFNKFLFEKILNFVRNCAGVECRTNCSFHSQRLDKKWWETQFAWIYQIFAWCDSSECTYETSLACLTYSFG